MFDPLAPVPDVFFLTSFKTPAGSPTKHQLQSAQGIL